jgi:RNA polymerase sigma factor (sigma-70 family)
MGQLRRVSDDHGDLSGRSIAEWAGLFDAHHNAIWRYLCRRAGPTAADDLTGEVFLRAARLTERPDVERAWLYGIATNLLRERSRKEMRGLRAFARSVGPLAESLDADAIVDRVDAAAMASKVASELARLGPNDRDTFLLYALTELDYAGIATATGVPIGTVRSRLHRARRRLRHAIGEDELDPAATTTTEPRTA